MKTFLFSCCTKNKRSEFNNPCSEIEDTDNIYRNYYENNTAISVLYNESINRASLYGAEWLVLHHDDIRFDTTEVTTKIEEIHTNHGFQVIGVAGASRIKIEEPALWHIMGQKAGQSNLHGAVAHGDNIQKHMTSFGVYPNKAVLIDGVFMAIHRDCFTKVQFDENNPAKFHFYDLNLSLDAALAGFKVGVGDIMITHKSPGLRDFTPEFLAGQEYFFNKYSKYKGKIIEA